MKKNDSLEIHAVGNGFEVFPGRCDGGYMRDRREVVVFETRRGLLDYLRDHFDEASKAQVEPQKKAA